MSKPNKTIGRRGAIEVSVDADSKELTLDSGETAFFELKHISHEELVANSFVDEKVNGREQSGLTEDNLSGVRESIRHEQYYSAYVVKDENGKYEFIDGSRRRMSAINEGVGLEAYVTEDELSFADKIILAERLQTAKEHNIRELGLKISNYIDITGAEQKDVAKKFGKSPAAITRLLKAASIDNNLLINFPDRNLLSIDDYSKLALVQKHIDKTGISPIDFVEPIKEQLIDIKHDELTDREKKVDILTLIFSLIANTKKKEKAVVSKLVEFKDKNKYVKSTLKSGKTTIEFKGITDDKLEEIKLYIQQQIK